MTIEVEAWFVKYSSKKNMDNGKIIKGTVEMSFGLGDKGKSFGPVKAESAPEAVVLSNSTMKE